MIFLNRGNSMTVMCDRYTQPELFLWITVVQSPKIYVENAILSIWKT